MKDTQSDPRRRLPPFVGALIGTPLAWGIAEIFLAGYTDGMHILAAISGLSVGWMAGVGVRSVVFKDAPQ